MWSFRGQTALLVIQTHESSRMHPGYTKEAGKPQTIFFIVFPKRQSSLNPYPFPTLYSQKGQIFHFSSTAGSTFFNFALGLFLATPSFLSHPVVSRSPLFVARSFLSLIRVEAKVRTCVASFRVTSPGSLGSSSSSACQTSLAEYFLRPQRSKSSEASHLKPWVWRYWRRYCARVPGEPGLKLAGGGARSGGWKGLVGRGGQRCRWAASGSHSWQLASTSQLLLPSTTTLLSFGHNSLHCSEHQEAACDWGRERHKLKNGLKDTLKVQGTTRTYTH